MHEAEGKFRKHESFAGRGFQGLFVGPGRAWKVQAHFTDRGKIFGRMVFARTVIVLVKNDIRNMVQLVFNLPMRADGFPMPAGVQTLTGNIIPVLLTLFSLVAPFKSTDSTSSGIIAISESFFSPIICLMTV